MYARSPEMTQSVGAMQQANEKGNRGKSSGKEAIAEPGAEKID